MRAIQIVELTGPRDALRAGRRPRAARPTHPMTPGHGVVVDVSAAGVLVPRAAPDPRRVPVKPELPFIPGSEVGGIVRSALRGRAAVKPGDRVAAFCG